MHRAGSDPVTCGGIGFGQAQVLQIRAVEKRGCRRPHTMRPFWYTAVRAEQYPERDLGYAGTVSAYARRMR
eukprot:548125-Rhodomonas_salina.2